MEVVETIKYRHKKTGGIYHSAKKSIFKKDGFWKPCVIYYNTSDEPFVRELEDFEKNFEPAV